MTGQLCPVEPDAPGIGAEEAVDEVEQGGLAGPVRPDDPVNCAGRYR